MLIDNDLCPRFNRAGYLTLHLLEAKQSTTGIGSCVANGSAVARVVKVLLMYACAAAAGDDLGLAPPNGRVAPEVLASTVGLGGAREGAWRVRVVVPGVVQTQAIDVRHPLEGKHRGGWFVIRPALRKTSRIDMNKPK